jgi:hypothetical protein
MSTMTRCAADRAVRQRASATLVLAGLLFQPWAAAGESTRGTSRLSGRATDPAGEPVPGAKVVLRLLERPAAPVELITDPEGRFEAEHLLYGHYQVTFESAGKGFPANRVLTIPPRKRVEASFTLGPFAPADAALGLVAGAPIEGLSSHAEGIARLSERTGRTGWAWFTTGKGVAVLVAGGAALVAGLIALSGSDSSSGSSSSGQ